MAGGVKKPVNIFKLKDLGEPKNVFNWRLWFAVISFGLLGAARGVDEGLISGAFNSKDFQRTINYSSYGDVERTNIKANVSAMVQIGSVGGALFAFVICDRIGRIWATRQLCLLWILGIAIFMGNGGSVGAVYAGRFIAGLGVGQTPVVGPIYGNIAEIAPASIRGLCTCIFTGFVYVGIVLAYFTNYGAQINLGDSTHVRWLAPTSLHIIFAGLIFILTFFQYESPRFLIKQGRHDEATETMAHIRHLPVDDPYVLSEINAIRTAHEEELEATMGSSWYGVLKEMFLIPSNLYRLYLSAMVQFLSQWSGAGSITLYAPDLFKLLGITGQNESLLVTGVFGIVKFVSAVLCALFLVDVIGRKRALLLGITLQAISMIYVAGFLTAVPELGVEDDYVLPAAEASASRGAIAMIYISGCGWALGWNSMQYLLTAELFPLRIRALSTSIVMTLHFVNQYGNSRAVPNMLLPTAQGGISPMGTFWFFGAITIVGGLWVWFFVPETGGRSLESMDRLFELPWYKIGRHGNEDAERKDEAFNEKAGMDPEAEQVEIVGAKRAGGDSHV
ncbi:putative MFS quinate transporter [Daldinia caldariorum]|uniref:putative MFS quinate transporter n=1 Tax=Daldinia caldariorum TaxID=326644 RepID=UPI00200846B1|nr:putative MFS quinate transporter [Daldinia caldariorum]KAI1463827.1 putative MFS quinate transporter [Daldinia caldariorum]